jgi:hypothetical protein
VTLSIKKRIDKHKKWEVGPGKVVTDPSPCQANAACKVHLYKQKEVTVTAKW